MESNERLKELENDPELIQSLKEALNRNAGVEELSGILTGAGVDAAIVDELLTEYQLKRGAAISVQELDDEDLEHVAGGDNCYSDHWCDQSSRFCSNQSNCSSLFYCTLDYKCESYF